MWWSTGIPPRATAIPSAPGHDASSPCTSSSEGWPSSSPSRRGCSPCCRVVPESLTRRPAAALLIVGLGLAVIVLLFLLFVPLGRGDGDVDSLVVGGHPLVDQPAPEIDLVTLDGGRMALSELRGRPVLVNFWA